MKKALAILGLVGGVLLSSAQVRAEDLSLDGQWVLQESGVINAIEATYGRRIGFFDFESRNGFRFQRGEVLHSTNNRYVLGVTFVYGRYNKQVRCILHVQADSQATPLALENCGTEDFPNQTLAKAFYAMKRIETVDPRDLPLGLRPSEASFQNQ